MARKKNVTDDQPQPQHQQQQQTQSPQHHQQQQQQQHSNQGNGRRSYHLHGNQQQQQHQRHHRHGGRAGEGNNNSYLEDDDNYPSFLAQLKHLGLEVRDIPGDGNCLFRALGDQLEGNDALHMKHRSDACQYMLAHKEDFAPFVDDSTSFEDYVRELARPGTYAGNDAIVAFARMHKLNIVIHQLDSAPWQIGELPAASQQLHLAYHNGEHYSSIRRLGDRTALPANVAIKFDLPSQIVFGKKAPPTDPAGGAVLDSAAVDIDGVAASGIGGVGRIDRRQLQSLVSQVAGQTGCDDTALIVEALRDLNFDLDETVAYVCQVGETIEAQQQQQQPLPQRQPSRKELKLMKKERATERHRQLQPLDAAERSKKPSPAPSSSPPPPQLTPPVLVQQL